MEVTGAAPTITSAAGWLDWERAGSLTRFVETAYNGDETERAWRERFGDVTINAQPMSLREIFMSLARRGRTTRQEASA